jgi:Cof subfamily protein (haloacid dehalogenase superfamily)
MLVYKFNHDKIFWYINRNAGGNMKFKALVLDLDGTLLTSHNIISEKTQAALLAIQAQGITVILASGRPIFGMLASAHALNLKENGGYLLSYNGAQIIRMADNTILVESSLDIPLIHRLVDEANQYQIGFIAYRYDHIITPKIDPYIQMESDATGLRLLEVKDVKTVLNERSVKCLMTGEPEYLESVRLKLLEDYHNDCSIYRSMPYFLELVPKGIDKGSRLKTLASMLNFQMDEIIACGDGFNDLSLIEVAGLGVAMGNSCQELKDKADYITATNDQDGIVQVIQQFMA